MKRVNYHLPEKHIVGLRKVSDRTGYTVAELIRQAIEKFLKKELKNGKT